LKKVRFHGHLQAATLATVSLIRIKSDGFSIVLAVEENSFSPSRTGFAARGAAAGIFESKKSESTSPIKAKRLSGQIANNQNWPILTI